MGVSVLELILLLVLGVTFAGALWAFFAWIRSRNLRVAMILIALAIYIVVAFLAVAPHYSVRETGIVVKYTTTTTIYDENGTPVTVNATVVRPVLEKNPAPAAYAPLVFTSALVLVLLAFAFLVADIMGWWRPF